MIEAFFSKNFPFNTEGLSELIGSFEIRIYKKGEIILEPLNIERELKFINSGFVREYYSAGAKEVNINFYSKGEFPTDVSSFYNSTQTKKWQECITDIEVQSISKKIFDNLLEKYSCGHAIISKSMQKLIKVKNDMEFNRATKSTEELYNDIVLQKPFWLKSIPQYHIASYLNVTPETLSRIRSRKS